MLERCGDGWRRWGAFATLCGLLVSVVGFVAVTLGVRISGPPQAIAALAKSDTAIIERVVKLEQGAESTRVQLGRLGFDLKFLSYQSCVKDRSNDPVTLDRCRSIVESMRPRGGGP